MNLKKILISYKTLQKPHTRVPHKFLIPENAQQFTPWNYLTNSPRAPSIASNANPITINELRIHNYFQRNFPKRRQSNPKTCSRSKNSKLRAVHRRGNSRRLRSCVFGKYGIAACCFWLRELLRPRKPPHTININK